LHRKTRAMGDRGIDQDLVLVLFKRRANIGERDPLS
jgi:hypothetical protein